jgi:hypothetical protein
VKKIPQQLARLLAGADPHTLPDDPVINERLGQLAHKTRQESMMRFALPCMVAMTEAGMSDRQMLKKLSPVIEQWLGYSPSQASNFWKRIKREQPALIEDAKTWAFDYLNLVDTSTQPEE